MTIQGVKLAKQKIKSYVTIHNLPKPRFSRLIRLRVVSWMWFPIRDDRLMNAGASWLLSHSGLVGSRWDRRHVWRKPWGEYGYWGLWPQRAQRELERSRVCDVIGVDAEQRRVRVRYTSTCGTAWLSVRDLVHMWRLASWGRRPKMPKGVQRKPVPLAIAGSLAAVQGSVESSSPRTSARRASAR